MMKKYEHCTKSIKKILANKNSICYYDFNQVSEEAQNKKIKRGGSKMRNVKNIENRKLNTANSFWYFYYFINTDL